MCDCCDCCDGEQSVSRREFAAYKRANERRFEELEDELEQTREERDELAEHVEELEQEKADQDSFDAHLRSSGKGRARLNRQVRELQARELQKGAHLDAENVSREEIRNGELDPYIEGTYTRVERDGGDRVCRLDGEGNKKTDPLGGATGSHSNVSDADLLPIQRIAALPDEVLETEKKEVRAAVWMWRDMTSDDPEYWSPGNNAGNIAFAAWKSDLTAAAREKFGLSKDAARKLLSRAIENVLQPWSDGAVKTNLQKQRKNGLEYRETRLFVTKGTEIPGWKKPTSWTQSNPSAEVTSD